MFVHAHPDDESLWTGGTIAEITARGDYASLVTATWAPGTHRHIELLDATAALGMDDEPIMLGYADSHVPDSAPGAPRFVDVPFDEQVQVLTRLIRAQRPEAIVGYDSFGIYGHIDHIHAHRLAVASADAAARPGYGPDLGEPWQVRSQYFVTLPQSTVDALLPHFTSEAHIPVTGTPDAAIDVTLELPARLGTKIRAITSHRSELSRSQSMQQFAALPREPQRLFLSSEAYQRRDLVTGGVELSPAR
ncbi:MAG: PIG-L family deacetylase [Gordonia sp. (in: high G+C Gram-positive bacteria)]